MNRFALIIIITLVGCGEQTISAPTEVTWQKIDSPKKGYDCYMHRSYDYYNVSESAAGYESTVCFPVDKSSLGE